MAIILPVVDGADGGFVTSLEGTRFRFKTRWNSRTECWSLAVETDQGVPIIGFEKILPRIPMINHNLDLFSAGNVYAISSIKNNPIPINRNNLGEGKEYQLKYLTNAELGIGV